MPKIKLKYQPPGPVSQAFYENFDNRVQMIMGPMGSAKTSTALMKFVLIAMRQKPSPIDGVRYTRFIVIRDTYVNLDETTIPSWWDWMPKEIGNWTGGKGTTARHHIRFNLAPKGQPKDIVDMKVVFKALGDKSIAQVMKGSEYTAAYLNEADGLLREAMTFTNGRVGRYPSKRHGGPTWSGLLMDMNAPDDENYTYEVFVEKIQEINAEVARKKAEMTTKYIKEGKDPSRIRLGTFAFYRQPGGMEEGAENLQNLPDGYYENLCAGAEDWWIRRNVDNEFGQSRDGEPVYPEYKDSFHCAPKGLHPLPNIPVTLGADQGRWGGILFGQKLPTGQWRIFYEILAENIDATILGRIFNEILEEKFPNIVIGNAWCDPAGGSGSDHDATTFISILSEATGIRWKPAPIPSNSISVRLTSVRVLLNKLIDGKPAILVSPVGCPKLRKGFNSGYHYKRQAEAGGSVRVADKPNKQVVYATPHDCLQYMMVGEGEHLAAIGRVKRKGQRRVRNSQMKSNFNPLGRLGG